MVSGDCSRTQERGWRRCTYGALSGGQGPWTATLSTAEHLWTRRTRRAMPVRTQCAQGGAILMVAMLLIAVRVIAAHRLRELAGVAGWHAGMLW